MADHPTEDAAEPTEGWLWHPGHAKLYRPLETADGGVVMLSVWHPEEVADARESDALRPAETVGLDRTDTTFDLLDSFRFLDSETVAAVREALDE